MVEIISEEQNKLKTIQRTEDSLRDLRGNVKHSNTQIIGKIKEKKRQRKSMENYFKRL